MKTTVRPAVILLAALAVVLAHGKAEAADLPQDGFLVGAGIGVGGGDYGSPESITSYTGGFLLPTLKVGYRAQWFEVDLQATYNYFYFGIESSAEVGVYERMLQKGQLRGDILLRLNLFNNSTAQMFIAGGPVTGLTFHYTQYDESFLNLAQSNPLPRYDGRTETAFSYGWTALAGFGYWTSESWRWSAGLQYVSGWTLFETTKAFMGLYAVVGIDFAI